MTDLPAPLRIGVNTLFLIPGEVGGSETYLRETLVAIQRLPDIQLHLFTNTENHRSFQETLGQYQNVECQQIPCHAKRRPERILVEQFLLPREVTKAPVDLLWNPGYTAPMRLDTPMVTSILDMQYKHYPEDLSALARLTTDRLVRSAARRSRRVITISEFSRQDIIAHTRAAPDRIHVTHLAVDEAFAPAPGHMQHILPDTVRAPFLLCVANSYPHKNLPALVKAFGETAERMHHHQLVIVGHARRGESELQAAIKALPEKIRSRIVRPRQLSRDMLIQTYQAADLFLFPSRYEGFGLPVLEAMLAGTRVVTTRCASIPEVAGHHAILADTPDAEGLAQALDVALSEPHIAHAAACRTAAQWARGFTWDATARKTVDVFKAALLP